MSIVRTVLYYSETEGILKFIWEIPALAGGFLLYKKDAVRERTKNSILRKIQ